MAPQQPRDLYMFDDAAPGNPHNDEIEIQQFRKFRVPNFHLSFLADTYMYSRGRRGRRPGRTRVYRDQRR